MHLLPSLRINLHKKCGFNFINLTNALPLYCMKCGMHFAEYHTLTMSNPFNSHEMPSIVLKPSDGNTFYK